MEILQRGKLIRAYLTIHSYILQNRRCDFKMQITLNSYINNPTGSRARMVGERQAAAATYTDKFEKLLLKSAGAIEYHLFRDAIDPARVDDKKPNSNIDRYIIIIKIPSESVPRVVYDVAVEFYTRDTVYKKSTGLDQYYVKFFSNDPNFNFTYAYTFKKNRLIIDELMGKLDPKAMKEKPKITSGSPNDNQWFIIKKYIICNPYIWCLCLVLCCIQMVRFSVLDWATKFLYETRGIDKIQVVWIWNIAPLLGVPGGLISGYIASRFFKGYCSLVTLGDLLFLISVMYGYLMLAGISHIYLTCMLLGLVAFSIEGIIVLVDVIIMRFVPREVVGTVIGLGGGLSYILGAAIGANFFAVYIVANHGWDALYYICMACVLISVLLISVCTKKEYSA